MDSGTKSARQLATYAIPLHSCLPRRNNSFFSDTLPFNNTNFPYRTTTLIYKLVAVEILAMHSVVP